MRSLNINISTRFFGLNKTDVKSYFEALLKEQEKTLEDASRELANLKRERDLRLAELEESKKDEIRYEDDISAPAVGDSKVVSDAYKRLDKTVALINMVADEEAAQLAQNANKKLEEYDDIIEKLQDDISDKKQRIESLLGDVLGILKANIDEVTSKKKKPGGEDRFEPEKEERTRKVSRFFEEEEFESSIDHINSEKITADGTSLKSLPRLLMFQKKYGGTSDNTFDEPLDFKDEKEDELKVYQEDAFEDIDDEPQEEIPQAEPEPEGGNINKMRNALIIGKIAGEDITDVDNNVVIQKGKVLTEEDIALAESTGKLPELIINMWLPK